MNVRDATYLEDRLLAPDLGASEAIGRLRQLGLNDEAEKLLAASQAMHDACRALRYELFFSRTSKSR